jgi:hypothetical protein
VGNGRLLLKEKKGAKYSFSGKCQPNENLLHSKTRPHPDFTKWGLVLIFQLHIKSLQYAQTKLPVNFT